MSVIAERIDSGLHDADELWNESERVAVDLVQARRNANGERFAGRNLPLPDQTGDGVPCSKYALAPNVSRTDDIWREVCLLSNCEAVFAPDLSENSMIDNLYVGTVSGISYRYSKSNLYDRSYDPRRQNWYQRAVANPDETIWLDTYTDSYGHMCITSARTFCDAQGNVAGVVASDIRLRDMLGEISMAKIGQSGYAFVMDKNRQLIAHPDYFTDGFQNDFAVHVQAGGSELETAQEPGGKSAGIVRLTLDGVDSYVAFSVLDETGWCLCICIDCDEVIQPALDTMETIEQITDDAQRAMQEFMAAGIKQFVIFLWQPAFWCWRFPLRWRGVLPDQSKSFRAVWNGLERESWTQRSKWSPRMKSGTWQRRLTACWMT